jgi:EpsI family protein
MLNSSGSGFLRSTAARVLTLVLVGQAVAFYAFSRTEIIPASRSLAEVPHRFAAWELREEGAVEPEIMEVLKADEVLTRSYASPSHQLPAHLFVAYFKSQRTGRAPHSPKNCLPGSGWVPSKSDVVSIPIDGRQPISVNRYVIQRGDAKSLVYYWYQSRDRVVAGEYTAKFYVVADAIRYNRTDTALVRVVVPIANDTETAEKAAVEFVQQFFNPLRQHFPA